MDDDTLPERSGGGSPVAAWPLVVTGFLCLLLASWLKLEGIILGALIMSMAYFVLHHRPDGAEAESLATSIRLSAEDIADVIEEFERFRHGTDADTVADRSQKRPALADPDCSHPDIETFYLEYGTARRFLDRLDERLSGDLSVPQLETLLGVTDRKALDLRDAWARARRAALHLGADYD
ncbi:hypothetical protein M0E87_05335 [Corynebacterium sp. CCM 9185]|uniref:Uncharacterized protein n=1 Tax=Corynebacterium marambiense TaxID=2765364 RepID=A0ABS0VV64_9CORY|nr:hypothetical protein [Corynebacterium marambiense]MBI9000647.1 hypothetical protein [Corynebacterium marambiense]MCK7663090.1 hypothetical protein [Corynebacterium marambiense]MCX7542704.1 hypothetical protein [Corynebacterium marambiense]